MITTSACQAVAAPSRVPPDLITIRAKKREISVRYAWQACQRNGEISKSRMMTLRRLNELERLYAARQCLVDDDAGREYLEIAAHHIAHLNGDVEKHIVDWSLRWAPWLSADEAKELAKRVADKPRKWKAASLGDELHLTPEERDALNIGTFRPAGWTKSHLDKVNKEKRRRREKERRLLTAKDEGRILRARRGRPRKTGPTPWERAGMSRAEWYRRGKPNAETIIRAHQSLVNGRHAFPSQAEPSRSEAPLQDTHLVSFTAKHPSPIPATSTVSWSQAA